MEAVLPVNQCSEERGLGLSVWWCPVRTYPQNIVSSYGALGREPVRNAPMTAVHVGACGVAGAASGPVQSRGWGASTVWNWPQDY